MAADRYDVIVVGGRCAGAPTAMLLARAGHRVLLVDRASFPSDTVSTHLVHPPGVAALRRWGILDRLIATGCPPIGTYAFDLGPFVIEGSPGAPDAPHAYAPRRTRLDHLLVEAAAAAGVEVRERFTVGELLVEGGRVEGIRGRGDDGGAVTERARVVVGADGLRSLVAKEVDAEAYRENPPLLAGYYSYWSGLPMDGRFEAYDRGDRNWAAWPTNDDCTLVVLGWPIAQFEENRKDVEGQFPAAFERAPAFAERFRGAKREDRFYGMSVPNYFRKPFGPGWALVGDAGYNRDFITAQGISDAFLDAENCAAALHRWLSGTAPFDEAMGEYRDARDARVGAIYEFTCDYARLEPPPPERIRVLQAVHGNQEAMDGFARMVAGVVSPAQFFSPENVERILAASANG